MKSTSRSALAVGAFFVIGVVLIVSMISFFGSGLPWQSKLRAVAYFKGSLSGLTVGAPVTFRGVRVGNVERIELRIDGAQARAQIPVFLRLNPDAAQWRSGDGAAQAGLPRSCRPGDSGSRFAASRQCGGAQRRRKPDRR